MKSGTAQGTNVLADRLEINWFARFGCRKRDTAVELRQRTRAGSCEASKALPNEVRTG